MKDYPKHYYEMCKLMGVMGKAEFNFYVQY